MDIHIYWVNTAQYSGQILSHENMLGIKAYLNILFRIHTPITQSSSPGTDISQATVYSMALKSTFPPQIML